MAFGKKDKHDSTDTQTDQNAQLGLDTEEKTTAKLDNLDNQLQASKSKRSKKSNSEKADEIARLRKAADAKREAIAAKLVALKAEDAELARREARLRWTPDEARTHENHLKMMLAGIVLEASKKDFVLKATMAALIKGKMESAKDQQKADFEELSKRFS